jgi:hypothetical protein
VPDEDSINLEHTVETHEAELDRQSKEISALMDDLKRSERLGRIRGAMPRLF